MENAGIIFPFSFRRTSKQSNNWGVESVAEVVRAWGLATRLGMFFQPEMVTQVLYGGLVVQPP